MKEYWQVEKLKSAVEKLISVFKIINIQRPTVQNLSEGSISSSLIEEDYLLQKF